ncbi:hypothetical protein ABIB40_003008 [Pedobacter sp. UYP30]|uniref:hypothetical protein n=1 Tax=Pedobacter sp. UYP30 TaxID=1756400 RepID=UPI00339A8A87
MRSNSKLLTLIFVSFLPAVGFSQIKKDSIEVKYSQLLPKKANLPSYFLNGVLLDLKNPVFSSEQIASIDIKNETPSGEIYITTKNDRQITFLTPLEIKNKYAKRASSAAIYFVDGQVIDESTTKIEEGYILSVNVTLPGDLKLKGANQNLSLIQISTRSKENLEKFNEVRIKGLGK